MDNRKHVVGCDCFDCAAGPSGTGTYLQELINKGNKANYIDHTGRAMPDFVRDHYAKYYSDVQWNTEPILANVLTFWKDWWDPKTWIKWHGEVKANYGQQRANEVFIQWFSKAPLASPTTDFRSFDDDFIKYAKQEGFYDALFSGMGGLIGKVATVGTKAIDGAKTVVGAAGDAVATVTSAAGSIVTGAANAVDNVGDIIGGIGKNLKWIIIAAVVIGIVILYFKYRKQLS